MDNAGNKAERTGDYEWRVEGEEAEAFLYAPDEAALEYPRLRSGIRAATRMPGIEGPVFAAASPFGSGWAVSSASHVAPGLVSAPRAGVLLVAASPLGGLGVSPEEFPRLLSRRLGEVSVPSLGERALRAACESGAGWAAEESLLEEEDLDALGGGEDTPGDPDALGKRALAAGVREWDPRPEASVDPFRVGETLDSEAADRLGLYEGALVLVASVGSGELGRITLGEHRDRITAREFGDSDRLSTAPVGSGEATDFSAAVRSSEGYAVARLSLLVYALRRALAGITGGLEPALRWDVGGLEERDGAGVHRRSLARLGAGRELVCGRAVARGTGAMLGSAPQFSPLEGLEDKSAGRETGDRWPWEEARILERIVLLQAPEDTPG